MAIEKNKLRGRDPIRREEILQYVRGQINSGRWQPGATLPPRTSFEQMFSAAPITVQKAFEVLQRDGLIECHPRRSTRVNPAPPHLSRYAIVLHGTGEMENLFCRTIVRVSEQFRRQRNLDLRVFFDLDCRQESQDHQDLLYGVENNLFAGLFFASYPQYLLGTPIMTAPGIPRIMTNWDDKSLPGVVSARLNYHQLEEKALEYLAANGARQVAMLLPTTRPIPDHLNRLKTKISRLNMTCPSDYLFELYPNNTTLAASLVELLFNRRNRSIPDALFVGDDNFLPYAIEGLERALGPVEARRITVVSHANYPRESHPSFPVKFFYINVLDLIAQSIHLIDNARNGHSTPNIKIDIFEETQGV